MRHGRLPAAAAITVALALVTAPATGRPEHHVAPSASAAALELLSPARRTAMRQGRLIAPVDGRCVRLRVRPSERSPVRRQAARLGHRRVGAWFCGGPVRGVLGGWVQASVEPQRAGARSVIGWARVSPARLFVVPYRVIVHRARQVAIVSRGRRVVRRIRVGIGRPSAPTTLGVTHITGLLRFRPGQRAHRVYGPHVVALGLPSADGPGQVPAFRGRGVLAFHAGVYGASSFGCLHASAADLAWMMRHLRTGTRVRIVR